MEMFKSTEENKYKLIGSLKSQGIEPLPPTPITDPAKSKLTQWGLSDETIKNLQYFTSSFRYDNCFEKVARLSKNEAELFDSGSDTLINIKDFYDTGNRLDGQCGDIGRHWITAINKTGLLESINYEQSQTSTNKIIVCLYTGLSKTHFCEGSSNHVWNGLALIGKDNKVKDEIYFDAAFQSICIKEESGYTQNSSILDPDSVHSDRDLTIKIGTCDNDNSINVQGSGILGVSNDRRLAYGINFIKNTDNNEVYPFLTCIDRGGNSKYYTKIGKKVLNNLARDIDVKSRLRQEIESIYNKASEIKIVNRNPVEEDPIIFYCNKVLDRPVLGQRTVSVF